MAKQKQAQPDAEVIEGFGFNDTKVQKRFEPVDVQNDFQIRLPSLQWHGQFSDITEAVADDLLKQGYNRLRLRK